MRKFSEFLRLEFPIACQIIGVILFCVSTAQADPLSDWPGVFDPLRVPSLNVKIKSDDFKVIVADETFKIEMPALFWASEDGDELRL